MKSNDPYRVLAFEQLETKRSPAALLLAVAPLDDDTHAASEYEVQQRNVDSSGYWRQHHSSEQILHFIEQQSGQGSFRPWATPDTSECTSADQMMKLQDDALRTILIAESLGQS